jgi:pimeloyl-ACP methyl ester carboxylesterase
VERGWRGLSIAAAAQLGLTIPIPVIVAQGWSEEEKQAYRLADNELAARGSWDPDLLRSELHDLKSWNAPGYLLSDNLRAETPSCRDYADALNDLLAALGIDGFDIVANSFGTRVAQCFAYYRPGRIRRVVFTGTSIPHSVSPEERARSVEARARMIERGGYGFGDRAAALLGSAASADTLALVQQTVRATNPAGFMQAARFIAEAEMPPLAAGLTMPLLMVQGEKDRVAPAATNAKLLAAALPRARLVMLAGCGHLPEVEFPSCVNDLIAAHLS